MEPNSRAERRAATILLIVYEEVAALVFGSFYIVICRVHFNAPNLYTNITIYPNLTFFIKTLNHLEDTLYLVI
jgi:hypothetical protein